MPYIYCHINNTGVPLFRAFPPRVLFLEQSYCKFTTHFFSQCTVLASYCFLNGVPQWVTHFKGKYWIDFLKYFLKSQTFQPKGFLRGGTYLMYSIGVAMQPNGQQTWPCVDRQMVPRNMLACIPRVALNTLFEEQQKATVTMLACNTYCGSYWLCFLILGFNVTV